MVSPAQMLQSMEYLNFQIQQMQLVLFLVYGLQAIKSVVTFTLKRWLCKRAILLLT